MSRRKGESLLARKSWTSRKLWNCRSHPAVFDPASTRCWLSIEIAASRTVEAKGIMDVSSFACGTGSSIEPTPMRSGINSAASG